MEVETLELETLVAWMLRRHEEMAQTAAADGVVSLTIRRLKKKFQNLCRTGPWLFTGSPGE